MYLTRFRINTARRGARKLLSSPQAMHAAVLAGFARREDHTRDDARTLWRIDQGPDRQTTLYVSSPAPPDFSHLVEQAGWPTTETWLTRSYEPLLDSLDKGQTWAFRLTANPVRTGRVDGAKKTQRFGHVTVAQQTHWLVSRAERHGFSIARQGDGELNLVVRDRRIQRFARGRGDRPVTLSTVTYDGVLQVEDPILFRSVLMRGLGHARAYGCGLLTLASCGDPE